MIFLGTEIFQFAQKTRKRLMAVLVKGCYCNIQEKMVQLDLKVNKVEP